MMVFWTAGFVLLTLLINAPMLPFVLRITGLSKVSSRALAHIVLCKIGCVPIPRARAEQYRRCHSCVTVHGDSGG
jgi:hypothetical protein